MPDDDRVGLRADSRCVVELRQPDVVARQVGRVDLVPARLELVRERLEAPAAVPGTVDEHEPRHRAAEYRA